MACENTSKRVLSCALWIILLILTISIVVLVLFPTLYNAVLRKELNLERGTIATKIWEDIPLPIYARFYFFNITNADAFSKGSETLNVTEVGPYTYSSRWVKENLQWNSDSTVNYIERRIYQFEPDSSNGTEDDLIYTLNGPMILASALSKNYDLELRTLLSTLLGIAGEDVVIKRSIKQLTFGGYDDLIIKFAPILKPDIPFKDGKFCWLFGKNYTDDGLFNVFTGSDDASKRNIIHKWKGKKSLNYWKGKTCNKLKGTNVEYGPPIDNEQESYTFFQSLFCRSFTFNYTEDVAHFGIPSRRFRATYSLLANSTENPDNYCFEINKQRPSGVLDASSCQFGAPILYSYPHFHMADPSYLKPIIGLDPNGTHHGSFLDIEYVTGFTIEGYMRIQINIEISKIEGVLQTYNITKGIFPVLWFEINLKIDEDFANYLKAKTKNSKIIAYSVLGVLTVVSLISAVVFTVILYRRKTDSDTDDPLLDAADKEYNKIVNGEKHSKLAANGNKGSDKLTKEDEDDETDDESLNNAHQTDSETSRLLK